VESRFYYFNAGLHSSESGSPEMVMKLAYRLAVSDQPMIQAIRRHVLVLINPVSEPDGRDRFVGWFYRYLKGRTDFENLPETSPPYWGHYVYHDNNRDSHQKAIESTRAVRRMFFDYHPTIVHDLHESIALLQTWNGTGPWNPNLDPIAGGARLGHPAPAVPRRCSGRPWATSKGRNSGRSRGPCMKLKD
jgi:hypothetical protein